MHYHRAKGSVFAFFRSGFLIAFDALVNFTRRLGQQKQAAANKNDVAQGYGVIKYRKQGFGQADYLGQDS